MTDLTPIVAEEKAKVITQRYGENLKKAFTHDWIFSTWYEKIIVFGLVLWAFFNILNLVWRWII